MGKDCYIFGAGEESTPRELPPKNEVLVIAADGGYPAACRIFGAPDLVVGDFDSLGYVPENIELVRHPAEKDETDLFLAVDEGISRGAERFLIYGALGARLDHTVANLQLLSYLAARGYEAYLFGADGTVVTALGGGFSLTFPAVYRGTLSVFAVGGPAEEVTLCGPKYSLAGATLTPEFPLGVSNELLGAPATVSLAKGMLLLFFPQTDGAPLPQRNRI